MNYLKIESSCPFKTDIGLFEGMSTKVPDDELESLS